MCNQENIQNIEQILLRNMRGKNKRQSRQKFQPPNNQLRKQRKLEKELSKTSRKNFPAYIEILIFQLKEPTKYHAG